jgi:chorismate synthase
VASHEFGSIFKITTWGESHGPAIGVVIDGCPAGLALGPEDLIPDLERRAPGKSPFTSPRKENDVPEILSGIYQGITTGAPISIVIWNQDSRPQAYEPLAHLLRPGHADFTYLEKYGVYDHRGGGRASARETACRVAAGAVAKKLLTYWNVTCRAYLIQIGEIKCNIREHDVQKAHKNPLCCPDEEASQKMMLHLEEIKRAGDSVGGVVEFRVEGLPTGIGDPVYQKLDARLADAMLSIPASKGFEIGHGFEAATLQGSYHNDPYDMTEEGRIAPVSNHAGGILGGISTGQPILGRVAFKPTSSIRFSQKSVTREGQPAVLELPKEARHDPCVAVRAVVVVEAMAALVLVDAILMNRVCRL